MQSNWQNREIDLSKVEQLSSELGISRFLSNLLVVRGYNSFESARDFLYPKITALKSPFLMSGIYAAVKRVRSALSNNEKIGIFSDSDIDGLTSLVVLNTFLEKSNSELYIKYPIEDESYGLTCKAIDEFYANGVKLLITLDCGISDIEEIVYARSKGIEVIVCDHHELAENLPDAIIINPKQKECQFPFSNLAGVGVAFYFVLALLYSYLPIFDKSCLLLFKNSEKYSYVIFKNGVEIANQFDNCNFEDIQKLLTSSKYYIIHYKLTSNEISKFESYKQDIISFEDFILKIAGIKINSVNDQALQQALANPAFKKYNTFLQLQDAFLELSFFNLNKIKKYVSTVIPFVAIGTIADIMPIVDVNRVLVSYGVKAFFDSDNPPLVELKKHINSEISSKSISWKVSPLLNSPGRFGKSNLTADFLMDNGLNVSQKFNLILKMNEERKTILDGTFMQLISAIDNGKHSDTNNFMFIKSKGIHEGLTGLLANKISDYYKQPVMVLTETKDDKIWKGSGRVNSNFDFYQKVNLLEGYCEKIGGHAQAFGFSILDENIQEFIDLLDNSLQDIKLEENISFFDLELNFGEINFSLLDEMKKIEPFGHKNSEPVFMIRNLPITGFIFFGKEQVHGKYLFEDSQITAIGWNIGKEMQAKIKSKQVDILCSLEKNSFMNKQESFLEPNNYLFDFKKDYSKIQVS
jgi:single-stranded-DNA-specific exonuclease